MKLNRTKLMLQYCVLQGSYWASFCVLYAFATVFLLSRGFESSMIGVIIAVGNILGVILQPVVASIAVNGILICYHDCVDRVPVYDSQYSACSRRSVFTDGYIFAGHPAAH